MFVDNAQVFVKAGKGGDGAVSFRHEKYVDKGGPDGGDGGRGGDVVFRATKDLNTLLNFRYKPELIAENGQGGSKRNRRGRSGEPLVVKVPMGTLVRRDGIVVADLIVDGQEAVVARGGDGDGSGKHKPHMGNTENLKIDKQHRRNQPDRRRSQHQAHDNVFQNLYDQAPNR